MAASLAQLYKDCEDGFLTLRQSLEEHLEHSDKLNSRILDQYERFQIWAGNIGARQAAVIKTSLDWRVREAPKLRHQIEELLEDLTSTLEELVSIASGERPNRTSSPMSINDGSDSEKEGGLSEMDELLEMLSESIAGLFKITMLIQRATPRDRFVKAQSSAKEPINPTWDILHVSHKFPLLASDDRQWLQHKFGLANTQRRQFFRYVRMHREKKAAVMEAPNSVLPQFSAPELQVSVMKDLDLRGTQTILSSQKPASSFAQTAASTLAVAKLQATEQDSEDDAMSHTSFATSVNESRDQDRLRVPKLQDISQGQQEFECPYCYTIIKPRSHNQWKKHVFEDLRPYICTFKGCDTKLFSDRRTWFEHEVQNHRVAYQCRFCSHRAYSSEEELQKHLSTKHPELCPPGTIPAMLKASQEPQESFAASLCLCCTDWEKELRQLNTHIPKEDSILVTGKQFRNHLAVHQEQLALFALPKHYGEDEGDAESAGVAAGDSSANLSDASVLSIASSTNKIDDKTEKLLQKLKELLDLRESSDNYTLYTVVNQLLLEPTNADEMFRVILLCTHPLREELVKLTLDNGADLNQFVNGKSPLCIASGNQNLDLMRILLASGADILARQESEVSALHVVAQRGWIDGLQLLLKWKADVNIPSDSHSNRPIHVAAQNPDGQFLQLLIDAGAVLNQANMAGKTALHVAVECRNIRGVEVLLKNDFELNSMDMSRRTALHDAVCTAQDVNVDLLLSHGADPNTIDSWDNCPLISAVEDRVVKSGNANAIVRSLLDAGASIELWRGKVTKETVYWRVDHLNKLQQILKEIDSPVIAKIQHYIDETEDKETKSTWASRNQVAAENERAVKSQPEPTPKGSFPSPNSAYWLETEASQLEFLRIRKGLYGVDRAKFLDCLDMLGSFYQDWMSAFNQTANVIPASEATALMARLSYRLTETSIDFWIHKRQENAIDLMADVIRNFMKPNEDPSATSQYNIITAIAAAMTMRNFHSSPWRRSLQESDWKGAIECRDLIAERLPGAVRLQCLRCPDFFYWNQTIYNLHLTWHHQEEETINVNALRSLDQPKTALNKETSQPSFYSGPMIYGILTHDFKAEQIDELNGKAGESVMILAQTHPDWIVAKSITRRSKPGLLPLSFIIIHDMDSGLAVDNIQSALKAACIPKTVAWKSLDALLSLRNSVRLTAVQVEIPVRTSVLYFEISNGHDLYYIDCEMETGAHWILSRYFMEFYELQTMLLQQFPDEAKVDERGQRILPYLRGPAISNGRSKALDGYISHLFSLPEAISRCDLVIQFFTPGIGDEHQEPTNSMEVSSDTHEAQKTSKEDGHSPNERPVSNTEQLHSTGDLSEQMTVNNIIQSQDTKVDSNPQALTHVNQPISRKSLCGILVAGFSIFDIKLGSNIDRMFADWLIHVYALDLQEGMEKVTRTLLEQLGVQCSIQREFNKWLSNVVCRYLVLQHREGPLNYVCCACGRQPARLWGNQARYQDLGQDKSTIKLCVTCVVCINLLNIKHTSEHQQFVEWIVPEILLLGSRIIMTFSEENEMEASPDELAFQQQRSIIEYGLNILDAIKSTWQSSTGEERVAEWIWSIILKKPNSYVMSQRELDLFEQYEPQNLFRHQTGIKASALARSKGSRLRPITEFYIETPVSETSSRTSSTSFLFTIIDVEPNRDVHPRQTWRKRWLPPVTRDGIKPTIAEQSNSPIYRWVDGVVHTMNGASLDEYNLSTSLSNSLTFSTYTVFMDESQAFACVPFDARRIDVRRTDIGEWQYLGFTHLFGNKGRNVLSKITTAPESLPRLAGYKEDESSWIRDLFPRQYRSAASKAGDKAPVIHNGLVGSLALILALAAFTAPSRQILKERFKSGRRWESADGVLHRRVSQRGFVVAIWQDVTVPNPCTKDILRRLEDGLLGPILHCDNEPSTKISASSLDRDESPSRRQSKSRDDDVLIVSDERLDRLARHGVSEAQTTSTFATAPRSRAITVVAPPQPDSTTSIAAKRAKDSSKNSEPVDEHLSHPSKAPAGYNDSGSSLVAENNPVLKQEPTLVRISSKSKSKSRRDSDISSTINDNNKDDNVTDKPRASSRNLKRDLNLESESNAPTINKDKDNDNHDKRGSGIVEDVHSTARWDFDLDNESDSSPAFRPLGREKKKKGKEKEKNGGGGGGTTGWFSSTANWLAGLGSGR